MSEETRKLKCFFWYSLYQYYQYQARPPKAQKKRNLSPTSVMATFTTLSNEIQQKIFNYKTKMEHDDRWGWADAIVAGSTQADTMLGARPHRDMMGRKRKNGTKDLWTAQNVHTEQYGETPDDHFAIIAGFELSWVGWAGLIQKEILQLSDPDDDDYDDDEPDEPQPILPSRAKKCAVGCHAVDWM